MGTQPVTVYTEDLTLALSLADHFNVSSGADARTRATRYLSKAVAFMDLLKDPLLKGSYLESASAWTGPDLILDKDIAVKTARSVKSSDEIAGETSVDLTASDIKKLATLRQAFNLSSDKEAARLSVKIYGRLSSALWRGNGIYMLDKNQQRQEFDTDKIKSGLTFRY